ncbi:MAG: translation initiation factor [Candidatus Omnitrophica bacterium]|nr:translation initiation factor [Candidatus Omnitrophota bacterium]
MIDIPDSIFPTNEQGEKICPACRKALPDCTCRSFDPAKPKPEQFHPVVRLEKKGRRGKVVTVISGLPADADYLRTLTKTMKRQAASGGTQAISEAGGIIELQGDHRDTAVQALKDDGFQPHAA